MKKGIHPEYKKASITCACGNTFEFKEPYPACPNCQDSKIEIIASRELFVESIEVE